MDERGWTTRDEPLSRALKFRFSWFLSEAIDAVVVWGDFFGLGGDDYRSSYCRTSWIFK